MKIYEKKKLPYGKRVVYLFNKKVLSYSVANTYDLIVDIVNEYISSYKYELAYEIKNNIYDDFQYPKIMSNHALLEKLSQSNYSLARFGDGEFNCIIEKKSLPFQDYDLALENKLREILLSKNSNLLVGLPDVFCSLDKYTLDVQRFFRNFLAKNRQKIYDIIDFEKEYCSAMISRPYMGYKNEYRENYIFETISSILVKQEIVIVEGKYSRLGVGNDLFANAQKIERILCPAKNAFAKYSDILEICQKQEKNKIFILALGPTATCLAHDLSALGYRALDLGHIDVEYEWFLRKAEKSIALPLRWVNEVKNGKQTNECNDSKYLSEIICEIK